jgi:hypothetical protein
MVGCLSSGCPCSGRRSLTQRHIRRAPPRRCTGRRGLASSARGHTAGRPYAPAEHTVRIRSDCSRAISGPVPGLAQHGAAAQAPLHGRGRFTSALAAFSRLGPASRARGRPVAGGRCSIRASARALRDIVVAEAERWLGVPLWLDPFATAVDALVPWFFWRFPEPLAEGADALARPVWGPLSLP